MIFRTSPLASTLTSLSVKYLLSVNSSRPTILFAIFCVPVGFRLKEFCPQNIIQYSFDFCILYYQKALFLGFFVPWGGGPKYVGTPSDYSRSSPRFKVTVWYTRVSTRFCTITATQLYKSAHTRCLPCLLKITLCNTTLSMRQIFQENFI